MKLRATLLVGLLFLGPFVGFGAWAGGWRGVFWCLVAEVILLAGVEAELSVEDWLKGRHPWAYRPFRMFLVLCVVSSIAAAGAWYFVPGVGPAAIAVIGWGIPVGYVVWRLWKFLTKET